jgi:putative ABC transport system permease protein
VTLAIREIVRVRSRFLAVGAALTLIAVLVLLLGGLLDGLTRGSTGLLRAQPGELVVYAADARQTLERSTLTAEDRTAVAEVEGVAEAAGLGAAVVSAVPEGVDVDDPDADVVAVAVIGHEVATGPVPAPPAAEDAAWPVDERLFGTAVEEGDRLTLTSGEELVLGDPVSDVAYAGQATVWLPLEVWRDLVTSARPDTGLGGDGFNALTVTVAEGADPETVAAAIDEATGATETLTVDDAIAAIPGVAEQTSTFTAIIGATLAVAGLVVALFFALLTLERAPLYAVLKALGSTTREIAVGVAAQAVLVALGAAALAGALTVGLAALVPDGVPVELLLPRALVAVAGLVATAVVGSAVSLRRLTRIDPAEAIG